MIPLYRNIVFAIQLRYNRRDFLSYLCMNDLASQVHLWTQQLRAIAMTGLAFNPPTYDRERYEELLRLAAEMAATDGAVQADARLAQQLYASWRAQVQPGARGYVTPKVGVGAVVFNAQDELLLIQRPSGYWLYPTGWADIGYAPAEVAVKEVAEETGLQATPLRLMAVYDVRHPAESDIENHLYSLVFYCRLDGGTLNRHPLETLDAGFFPRDHLPQPLARDGLGWVEHAWAARRGDLETFFDRP
ncbi:MAG: NUDIX hydrolase N-terminal domain-containing protein [Anaerolineae bacterium]